MSRLTRLLLILLLLGLVGWLVVERPWADPPRTVVLISIDTLRPDRLGVYGNAPDVSPNIDALAKDSAVFEQALALSPWTLPSHMTMLTGLDPVAHGVLREGYHLSSRVVTLAEALKADGFRTAAFTDGGFVHHGYGFGQGFEVYRDAVNPPGMPNGFTRLLPEALEWMRSTRHEDSFVFIHTFDAHSPFQNGDPAVFTKFREAPAQPGPDDYLLHRFGFLHHQLQQRITEYRRMSELLADYDAGVNEADRGVGQVLELLKSTGRMENALVIITSDHGESFGDHGVLIGHGLALTDDQIHIPLVIHFPQREGAGQRIRTLADLSDLAPTVLEAMGLPVPGQMQGESLLGLLRQRPRHRDFAFGLSQNTEACFLVRDGFKFISAPALDPMEAAKRHLWPTNPTGYPSDAGEEYKIRVSESETLSLHYDTERDPLGLRDVLPDSPQLYDRVRDPKELVNLYDVDPQRLKDMAALTHDIFNRSEELREELDDGQEQGIVDPHQIQILMGLGYAGAPNPSAAQTVFSNLPAQLKQQAKLPWVAADTTELDQIDREAELVRQAIADTSMGPQDAQAKLQSCGDRYVKWLAANGYPSRVAWRIEDLKELGRAAGVTLDDARWREQLSAALGKTPKSPAPTTTPSK